MFDMTLRRARIYSDHPPYMLMDIGMTGGEIVEIAPFLAPGLEDHDLAGRVVSPGLVETHIHLDKACILDRCPAGRDLATAIAAVSAAKAQFTAEDVATRAGRTLDKAIGHGTQLMRTHVELDPKIGLRGLEGVMAAAAERAWAIDVEICVFPQEGLTNDPGVEPLLIEGLKRGARVIGGAPYTDPDPHGQIDRIFRLARDFDVDIDLHLDFSLATASLDADYVARKTRDAGWGGRVAIGHVSKLSALPPDRLSATARQLADAGVAVTVLPATDLYLMGREHDQLTPRGVAPVLALLAAGVNCSIATNNVLNPFTPFGDAALIRMANLYANIAQVGDADALSDCLAMVSHRAAQLMNRAEYGIAIGRPADLIVFDATDPAQCVAEITPTLMGFKAGRRSFTRAPVTLHPPGAEP